MLIFISLFFTMLIVEILQPRYAFAGSRLNFVKRIGTNLGLGALNKLFVGAFIFAPLTALATDMSFWKRPSVQSPWLSFITLIIDLLVLDGVNYFTHWLAHRTAFLWKLHAIHHLDQHLDVTTGFRVHFFEKICIFPFKFAVILIFALPLSHLAVFEVVSLAFGIFHHSNIRMNERLESALSYIVTTPAFHGVHHHADLPMTDSNYGFIFTFWDFIFGTCLVRSMLRTLRPGLDSVYGGQKGPDFIELLFWPIKEKLGGTYAKSTN